MAVNPREGTVDAAAEAIEGLFGSEELEGVNDLVEEEEVETEEVETEEEGETTDEVEDAEPEDEEPEEVEANIESLADVAEALELPLEDVLVNLTHTVKVDGESLEVSLDELARGYQKDADYRQKTEAVKREREAFEAERQQRVQMLEDEHAQNAYVLNTLEQQIIQGQDPEMMARLRAENPAEWTARNQEHQQQLLGIQRLKMEAAQRLDQLKNQSAQEEAGRLAQTVQEESRLLRDAIPQWNDSVRDSVNAFLHGQGYTPEQIGQVTDHRVVKMAYEAMMFRQGQEKAKAVTKTVKKAPKLVKPSTTSPTRVRRDEVRKLKSRLKKTGDLKDAAALIENLL